MLFKPFEFSGMKLKNRVVKEISQERKADLIGLGRPLLCDPDWVKKAIKPVLSFSSPKEDVIGILI